MRLSVVALVALLCSWAVCVAGQSNYASHAPGAGGYLTAPPPTTAPPAPVITSVLAAKGAVSVFFSYQITATNSPTSFAAVGLPANLTLDPLSGIISGYPPYSGDIYVSISASNPGGGDTEQLHLSIYPLGPTLYAAAQSVGTSDCSTAPCKVSGSNGNCINNFFVNISYAVGFPFVTGQVIGAYSAFVPSGVQFSLPAGDTYVAGAVQIGTLDAQISTANFTVMLYEQYPTQGAASPLVLPPGQAVLGATAIVTGMQLQFYAVLPSSAAARSLYLTLALDAEFVPASLGFYTQWYITVGNSASCSANVPAPVITSASTASGTVGSAFSYQITASNSPVSYASGPLPAGLTLNATTGMISGVPTSAGAYTVTISAINAGGAGTLNLTLTILVAPTGNCTFFNETLTCVGVPSGAALASGNGTVALPPGIEHQTWNAWGDGSSNTNDNNGDNGNDHHHRRRTPAPHTQLLVASVLAFRVSFGAPHVGPCGWPFGYVLNVSGVRHDYSDTLALDDEGHLNDLRSVLNGTASELSLVSLIYHQPGAVVIANLTLNHLSVANNLTGANVLLGVCVVPLTCNFGDLHCNYGDFGSLSNANCPALTEVDYDLNQMGALTANLRQLVTQIADNIASQQSATGTLMPCLFVVAAAFMALYM